jgi:hypothetical protein
LLSIHKQKEEVTGSKIMAMMKMETEETRKETGVNGCIQLKDRKWTNDCLFSLQISGYEGQYIL